MVTMAFPYALAAIGWKTYMINGVWDVLQVVFIAWYWIETSGKTLEEVDELIDGEKHSDVVDVAVVLHGKEVGLERGSVEGVEVLSAKAAEVTATTTKL